MVWSSLRLSLLVVGVATLVVGALGLALAFLLAKREFRGKELLDAVLTMPLVLPPTVTGYYLIVLLGRRGLVGGPLYELTGWTLVFTWQGAVVAAAIGALPLVVKTARASIASVDRDLEDAARTLGQSEWQVFRRVTLPLAARGIVAAAMLAFARALGDFGATLMVAGNIPGRTQTAAIAIYDATQAGRDSDALTLVLILSLIAFALLYATNRLVAQSLQR